jgi:hypothetical protein
LVLFERFYRAAAAVNTLLFIGMAVYVWFRYVGLPYAVAYDFGVGGRPEIGPKTRLITPLAAITAAAGFTTSLLTVFSLKRHELVERYPYLINLPAIALILGKLPQDRARQYIDRLFIPLPIVAAALAALMAFTSYLILESAEQRRLVVDESLLVAAVLSFAVGAGVGTVLYFRRIYLQLKNT